MYTSFFVASLGLLSASALPHLVERADSSSTASTVNDTQILQFALTLENLENAFYSMGLQQFNESAFEQAGYAPAIRQRFVQIMQHELTHVQFLQSALGDQAPQPCNYSFPLDDVASFVSTSFALESAGEAAYIGAGALLQNKSLVTTAAQILAVEARQASWVSSAALNNTPWNGPFDTPLNASAVFSLASAFIESCPSTNPPLIVAPLNTLTLTPSNATVGGQVTVAIGGADFNSSSIPITNSSATPGAAPSLQGNFLAYYHGINVTYSVIAQDNTTTVPSGIAGVVFTSVVSTNETAPTVDTTLSGLAVLSIPVEASDDNSFN
ncbi:ferritin-like domain-containing protein [Cytidiella melzeri]|nr:ferritin-like domain-containing protein [Cytidiella melzeri]